MTGEELQRARIAKRITQKKLGLMLGFSEKSAERMVQKWEYNEQGIPMKHFRKLSEILNVPLERFIP